MAGRARRVASRQGQLNRKRKRQQRGPSGIPVVTDVPVQEDEHPDSVATDTLQAPAPIPAASTAGQTPPVATRAAPASTPSAGPRLRRDQVSSANYVGAELRRILAMAGVILVVLFVLAFFSSSWR
ncbi:MAG: hypothetical protein IIC96_01435 [Chloroflexi bacterium]|nr:hypothetical protein [Chloroflexota bacterium]